MKRYPKLNHSRSRLPRSFLADPRFLALQTGAKRTSIVSHSNIPDIQGPTLVVTVDDTVPPSPSGTLTSPHLISLKNLRRDSLDDSPYLSIPASKSHCPTLDNSPLHIDPEEETPLHSAANSPRLKLKLPDRSLPLNSPPPVVDESDILNGSDHNPCFQLNLPGSNPCDNSPHLVVPQQETCLRTTKKSLYLQIPDSHPLQEKAQLLVEEPCGYDGPYSSLNHLPEQSVVVETGESAMMRESVVLLGFTAKSRG